MDYGLAEAFKIFEDERCQQCGTHMWHAYSENQNIKFDIEEVKCEACVVLDDHNDKQKDKKPGITPSVKVGTYFEDDPLPKRSDWFQEMNRKAELAKEKDK